MMMDNTGKVVWEHRGIRDERPFLQPLAVAIVCAVFVALILGMGVMDLQRIDRTLVDFLENRGLGIAGVVQRLAQENLNNLIQASKREEDRPIASITDEAFSPQKLLISALVDVGREVDNRWKADRLSEEYLRKYADEKGILLIAVLDKKGRTVFRNRTLPPELLSENSSSGKKRQEITIDLFNQLGMLKKIGFVALKRRDGSGTIVIALDPAGLRYWGTKVSIEKAIRELGEGQGQGLSYFLIMDPKEKTLGSAGQLPENWKAGEMHPAEILSGVRAVESRKVVYMDKQLLDMAAPIYLNGKIAGVVRLGLDRGQAETILAENRKNVFIFMCLTIFVAFASMWLLYHNQNRHMAGIVKMERQLEKAERLSALGQLAAGVAHEIRNPLNAISMASQRLKRDFVPADEQKVKDFQTLTTVIRDEIRRLNNIIEEFLTFSKSRRLDLHDFPVTEVLQKIVNLMQEEANMAGVVIETQWETHQPVIPMDMDKLQQALLNFIKNAMESITGGGKVSISLDRPVKGWVNIKISDTGCGMTAEEIEHIFSPDYTTKEKGLGLGLPLAHEIIRGHGGEIKVTSQKEKGTVFDILLPEERSVGKQG
ncbi:MAG: Adaptive-response sensory-kinase SasA [Syntrophus sp. SKADARSKE-3]|nr:Adaptive-response sensory-kinase SasA [Syntrophus sp. SKADARSKE-3]